MLDELLAVWRTHEAINRFMLDNIPEAGLLAVPLLKNGQPGRGRDVARVFAHLVETRLSHMRMAEKKPASVAAEFEKGVTPPREQLAMALAGSSAAVEAMLTQTFGAAYAAYKQRVRRWI